MRSELRDDRETRARAASAAASSAVCATALGGERKPERVQHAPHFLVGQPVFAARLERAPADAARLLGMDVVEAPEQTRRLRAPFGVGRDLARARGPRSPGRRRRGCARRRRRAAAAVRHRPSRTRAPVSRSRRRAAPRRCRPESPRRSPLTARVDRRVDDDQRVGVLAARTTSIAWRYSSGPAEATMSTGLPMLAAGGRKAPQPRRGSRSRTAGRSSPDASQASTARIPGPPALVTMATRRPAGSGCASRQARCRTSRRSCPRGSRPPGERARRPRRRWRRAPPCGCPAAREPAARAPGFHGDDRLGAADAARQAREPPRVPERLEIEQDDARSPRLLPSTRADRCWTRPPCCRR